MCGSYSGITVSTVREAGRLCARDRRPAGRGAAAQRVERSSEAPTVARAGGRLFQGSLTGERACTAQRRQAGRQRPGGRTGTDGEFSLIVRPRFFGGVWPWLAHASGRAPVMNASCMQTCSEFRSRFITGFIGRKFTGASTVRGRSFRNWAGKKYCSSLRALSRISTESDRGGSGRKMRAARTRFRSELMALGLR